MSWAALAAVGPSAAYQAVLQASRANQGLASQQANPLQGPGSPDVQASPLSGLCSAGLVAQWLPPPPPAPPPPQLREEDLRRFNDALASLEDVRARVRLVLARGNVPGRARPRVGY